MLADDLFRQIDLYAISPGVPVLYRAVRIEHVERVIGDAVHQQTETPLAFLESLGSLVPLGDVARDLGEADQFVAFVKRVDDDRREEPVPILADAPALGLALSFFPCSLQGDRRQPRFAILDWIEYLEVTANDLIGLISLDALRAGVPVGYGAAGVEHEDGVIDHPLHQQPEPAFALEKAAPATALTRHPALSPTQLWPTTWNGFCSANIDLNPSIGVPPGAVTERATALHTVDLGDRAQFPCYRRFLNRQS